MNNFNSRLGSALKTLIERELGDIEHGYHGRNISDLEPQMKPEAQHGAKGPEDDSLVDDELVGTEVRGIKLTAKGLHDTEDGFWYFPKFLRNANGEPKGEDGVYWYRKKRADPTDESEGGRMIEEYVGKSHEDLPFRVPSEFLGHIKKLEDTLKEKKRSKDTEDLEEDSED